MKTDSNNAEKWFQMNQRCSLFQSIIYYVVLSVILLSTTVYASRLSDAPPFPDNKTYLEVITTSEERQASAEQSLEVDPKSREESAAFYRNVYVMSDEPACNWTGNQSSCVSGQTAADFKNAVLQRLNYFRAMAGVPADVSFSDTYNSKAQEAALMMSANNSLSHYPPTNWKCYSTTGAEAAGSSNLFLGVFGWNAITGYIKDFGAGNGYVGHRRWILYPQTKTMGTGDIPETDYTYRSANALWVFDSNVWGTRPATRDDFVAWPPPGYTPYQIVFPRWSLSYPQANFTKATVTMTTNGNSVPVKIEPVYSGYGENTVVWIPNNMNDSDIWQKPVSDESYSVNIQNVTVNGETKSFDYVVTVFDPDAGGSVLSVSPTHQDVTKDAGTVSFTVSNTGTGFMAWTASVTSGEGWMRIQNGTSGTNSGSIICAIDPNTDTSQRTGVVQISSAAAAGSPKNVTVTQAGGTIQNGRRFLGAWSDGIWSWNYTTKQWSKIPSTANALMIAAGRVDGDQADDLIGVWSSGLYMLQSSDGQWVKMRASIPTWIITGDMNHDGRDDVIGSWNDDGVCYRDSANGKWIQITTPARQLAVGNIHGDGRDDLVGVWISGLWVQYRSTGAWQKIDSTIPVWIASGDMSGAGRSDIIGSYPSGIWYYNSVTTGWVKITSSALQVVVGDINGDGRDDLIGIWPDGVWVRYAVSNQWEKITSSKPVWITTSKIN